MVGPIDREHKSEQHKYERMWELDRYRERSPGERFFNRAVDELCPQHGDSLMDWGIGTGRAACLFEKYRGMKVEGIDIAANANREFQGKVWIGTMWNPPMPANHKFIFGYCTDVMEHLPPKQVLNALNAIRRHTIEECWFSIANFEDHEGDMIGEKLHLSVRPAEWWAGAFARAFPRFHFSAENKHYIVRAFSRRK